jgi:tetratricopeptide (TPR) repeat protein
VGNAALERGENIMPVVRTPVAVVRCAAVAVLLVLLTVGAACGAGLPNRLCRAEIKPHALSTRITLVFAAPQHYTSSLPPGGRVLLTFPGAAGSLPKRYRNYADARIGNVRAADRGDRLLVGLTFREGGTGVRIIDGTAPNVLIFDVGNFPQQNGTAAMPEGRERIWNGAGKLIREFSPSLKSELPFFPTPGTLIKKLIPAADVGTFLRGEEALYRERGAEAEEVFTSLLDRVPSARAIAAYRLGEAQYQLQKYGSALRWFREGERLWPEYMVESPSIVFCYGDTLARCGEIAAGTRMFERLIVGMADGKYGPLLLVRKGDIMARGGREMDAVALYRTVAAGFPGTRASLLASIRLADRRMFAVNGQDYRTLAGEYKRISRLASETGLKEEALFKWALLEALYGPVHDALAAVVEYGKGFPGGIFANVAKTMREELLVCLYRELDRGGDCKGLVRLALDNQGYLAQCALDRSFIPRISRCFQALGMVREELDLFSSLVETEWPGENTRFLYYRIIENSWTLGELPMTEAAAKVFLARFPADGLAGRVRDRLGWLQYRNGDMAAVSATLAPILVRKEGSSSPESYYYLGKACERQRDPQRAERSMEIYLERIGSAADTTLAADARMVLASGRLARRDRPGALAVFRKGFEVSTGERREMFLYKMGEVEMLDGKYADARACWERLVKEGRDPVWRSLAVQALVEQSWQGRLEMERPSK